MQRREVLSSFAALALAPALGKAAINVPRQSPEFALQLPEGGQVLLSKYKGQVVLLEVLLTTCPHCQEATKIITKLHQEYGPKGFQPLGVAIDPMPRLVIDDFKKRYGVQYPIGYVERDSLLQYLQHSPMMRLLVPQLIFIDRNGVIQAHIPGGDDFFKNEEANMRAMIEKLLAQKGAASKRKPS